MVVSEKIAPHELIGRSESIINPNSNLQYSLSLIEASIEYLANINDEKTAAKNMGELIPIFKNRSVKYSYSKEMLKELLRDHERIITQLRNKVAQCSEKYEYSRVVDFVSSIIKEHQLIAWELRKSF